MKNNGITISIFCFATFTLLFAAILSFLFIKNKVLNGAELGYLIIALGILVLFMAILIASIGLLVAHNHIFPGSGDPPHMANILLKSLFLQSQTILAILLIIIISFFISQKILTPSEGLPVMTGAVGFALGKSFTVEKKQEQQ